MRDGAGFEMEIVGEDFFSDGVVEVHCCFWGGFFPPESVGYLYRR